MVGLAVAVTVLTSPHVASAQGCSMCYTTAAAARQAAIQALRSGILILLIPPVLITLGIFALALRRQDRFVDDGSSGSNVERELNEWLSRMSPGSADVSPGAGILPATKSSASLAVPPKASS